MAESFESRIHQENQSVYRFCKNLKHIIEKYTDENYVSDIVDLETMQVIENNGAVAHIAEPHKFGYSQLAISKRDTDKTLDKKEYEDFLKDPEAFIDMPDFADDPFQEEDGHDAFNRTYIVKALTTSAAKQATREHSEDVNPDTLCSSDVGDIESISSSSSESSSDECSLSDRLDSESSYSSSGDEHNLWKFPSDRQLIAGSPGYVSPKVNSTTSAEKWRHPTPAKSGIKEIKSKSKQDEKWSPARTVRKNDGPCVKSRHGFGFAKVPSEIWSSAKHMAKFFISPTMPEKFDFANGPKGDGAKEKLLAETFSDEYEQEADMGEDLPFGVTEKAQVAFLSDNQLRTGVGVKYHPDPPEEIKTEKSKKWSSQKEKRRIVPSMITSKISPELTAPTPNVLEPRTIKVGNIQDSPQTAACKTLNRLTLRERNALFEDNSLTGRLIADEPLDLSRNRRKEKADRSPFGENRENVFFQKAGNEEKEKDTIGCLKPVVCEAQMRTEFDKLDISSKVHRTHAVKVQGQGELKAENNAKSASSGLGNNRDRHDWDFSGFKRNVYRKEKPLNRDLFLGEGSSEDLEALSDDCSVNRRGKECPRSPVSLPRTTKLDNPHKEKQNVGLPLTVEDNIGGSPSHGRLGSVQKTQLNSITSPVAFFKMMKLKQDNKVKHHCAGERNVFDKFAVPPTAKQSPSNKGTENCASRSRKRLPDTTSDVRCTAPQSDPSPPVPPQGNIPPVPAATTSTPTKRSKPIPMALDISCIPTAINAPKETQDPSRNQIMSRESPRNPDSTPCAVKVTPGVVQETMTSDQTTDLDSLTSYAKPNPRTQDIDMTVVSVSDTSSDGDETFTVESVPSPYAKTTKSTTYPRPHPTMSRPSSDKKGARYEQIQSSSPGKRHTSPLAKVAVCGSGQKGGSGRYSTHRGTSSTGKSRRHTPSSRYRGLNSDDSSSDDSDIPTAAQPHTAPKSYRFFSPSHRQIHSPSSSNARQKPTKTDRPKSLRQLYSAKSSPKTSQSPTPKVQEESGDGHWNWSLNHVNVDKLNKQVPDVYELKDSSDSDCSGPSVAKPRTTPTYRSTENLKYSMGDRGHSRKLIPSNDEDSPVVENPSNEAESLLTHEDDSIDSDSSDDEQPLLSSRSSSRTFSSSTMCHGPGKCDKPFCFTCV